MHCFDSHGKYWFLGRSRHYHSVAGVGCGSAYIKMMSLTGSSKGSGCCPSASWAEISITRQRARSGRHCGSSSNGRSSCLASSSSPKKVSAVTTVSSAKGRENRQSTALWKCSERQRKKSRSALTGHDGVEERGICNPQFNRSAHHAFMCGELLRHVWWRAASDLHQPIVSAIAKGARMM